MKKIGTAINTGRSAKASLVFALLVCLVSVFPGVRSASALDINPIFASSITGNAQAGAIENAINMALSTIEGLYSNNVTYNVNFSYTPGAPGNLLSTNQFYYNYTYGAYTTALQADATANPTNANLQTAVANLAKGNDANGNAPMILAYADALMLSVYGLATPTFAGNASINIASNQPFALTGPASPSQFDLIGGLEHELDETMGGGGGGSAINNFFPDNYGPLDLYRYSAPNTPSYTNSGRASSYLSIDGGVTSVVGFNQDSGGDFGDFAPACGNGHGQDGSNPGNN